MAEGRRPVESLTNLHLGDITREPEYIKKKLRDMHPDQGGSTGLGICRVVAVDYEEHFVTLRTVQGTEQEFERVPVPITYPGAGARHFLGAMPEAGDYCVVGWLPQDTTEARGTKTPVILTWIIPGVWPGRDWLTTANFTEDEHDATSSRSREELHGVFERVRHKLRHIQPGNIVASSSQGADLVLDENAHLANRRGNEFILRDADQAVVTRALQQFTALAGTRTYAGMVQRDALRLPTTMFSDGYRWDGAVQAQGGEPVHQTDLPVHSTAPEGFLLPAALFHRTLTGGKLSGALDSAQSDFDPYQFLRRGGYIAEDGVAVDDKYVNDAVYAGKPLFRVLADSADNGVLRPDGAILTEHRIEVAHTSNGLLPVTEQTDGFDAERLPPSDPDTPGVSSRAPYIEWVLGSVIGNDPFSAKGRKEYGIPLRTQVFDSFGGLSPQIEAVQIGSTAQGSAGTPLAEHAATLFKLTPISGALAPTWWSVNKQGQVRGFISGPATESGLDLAIAGGMRLAVGGGLELQLRGGIHFTTLSKNSVRLRSEQGPVVIYGGGSPAQGDETTMEQEYGSEGGDDAVPAVDIRARTNVRLWAERTALIKGKLLELNASTVRVLGADQIELTAAKQLSQSAEDLKVTVTGKRTDTFIGPKNLLPTMGALHERSYNPVYPGLVCEEVSYLWGDRNETFKLGSHTTDIQVGNLTYRTTLGTWKAQAGTNTLTVGTSSGIKGQVPLGSVSLGASAGSAQMTGSVSVLVESALGPATLRARTLLTLGAPVVATEFGPILCAGSIEPFTGLPYLTWGSGAKHHVIGV